MNKNKIIRKFTNQYEKDVEKDNGSKFIADNDSELLKFLMSIQSTRKIQKIFTITKLSFIRRKYENKWLECKT